MTRERVVDGALALADARGLDALTMRRLAADLGVEAMTLYYHLPNKAAILDAMIERVTAEFELPPPDADWKPALRQLALSAFDVLQRHPWAAGLMLRTRAPGPMRLRHMDQILAILARAGFPPTVADHAYHAIEGHVMGFTLWVGGMDLGTPDDLQALGRAFLQRLPAETYPHVAAHVEHHLGPRDPEDVGSFAFALDLLLDGLERFVPEDDRRRR